MQGMAQAWTKAQRHMRHREGHRQGVDKVQACAGMDEGMRVDKM